MINKIYIKNYRSIKDSIVITLEKIGESYTFIFTGINESGKSNILKAISLLNPDTACDYNTDCNYEAAQNNEPIEIIVNFDTSQITNTIQELLMSMAVPEPILETLIFESFERLITVDTSGKKDQFRFTVKGINYDKFMIKPDGNIEQLNETPKENLPEGHVLLTEEIFINFVNEKCMPQLSKQLPAVIFWKYEDAYLINDKIDLNAFKDNPNLNIPLKNIFQIAGISDISAKIESIKDNVSRKSQLTEQLGKDTTKYLREKWQEHHIEILVDIDNMQCSVIIKDTDSPLRNSMFSRSDGFKQFVSILLNISAENHTEQLKNCLILLDEPDIHIHPSGIKYLRDELLKVGERNFVFVATHSIFMVDRLNLDRHFKVEKNNSKTEMVKIDPLNPYADNVIYESLGTSIYEIIEPNILIFEGRSDKDIFDVFIDKFKGKIKPPSLRAIYAHCATKVPLYTKYFNRHAIKGFVILDSDDEGIRVKTEILKEEFYNDKNTWEINDILDTKKKSTIEDLIPASVLEQIIKDSYDITLKLKNSEPFIEQMKLHNTQSTQKINIDSVKIEIAAFVVKDVGTIPTQKETTEKYPLLHQFITELVKKIK